LSAGRRPGKAAGPWSAASAFVAAGPTPSPPSGSTYFATCPRGLEQPLAAELRAIGARVDAVSAAGVAFSGDRAIGYLANLHSRIASRVLLRLASGRYRGDDDLYRLATRCEWERYFDASMTLRVDVSAIRSPLRSLNFATLRVKDGIVDRFRARTGERPSIDTERPQVRVYAFMLEREATLYLDLSGEPLFKRGWRADRDDKGEAPLKENLAAGLIALSGWTPGTPLADPFCGSGTILIEAGQIAAGIAPGLSRGFGFEALLDHDAALWAGLRADAVRRVQAGAARARAAPIAGSDADPRAIEQARRNAQRAGLAPDALALRCCDVLQARAPGPAPGVVVTNPPYGERLELRAAGSPDAAWGEVGRVLKREFAGWKVFVLTSDARLPAHLGMKEKRRAPLYNGAIECRLFGFEIFARREDSPAPAPAA